MVGLLNKNYFALRHHLIKPESPNLKSKSDYMPEEFCSNAFSKQSSTNRCLHAQVILLRRPPFESAISAFWTNSVLYLTKVEKPRRGCGHTK